jgi:hypothetical protein
LSVTISGATIHMPKLSPGIWRSAFFLFLRLMKHAYRLIMLRDLLHHPRLSPCNDGAAAQELPMNKIKNIALVAHDNRKRDLIEWVQWNYKADFIGSSKIE